LLIAPRRIDLFDGRGNLGLSTEQLHGPQSKAAIGRV
jgi:hypothetical protein